MSIKCLILVFCLISVEDFIETQKWQPGAIGLDWRGHGDPCRLKDVLAPLCWVTQALNRWLMFDWQCHHHCCSSWRERPSVAVAVLQLAVDNHTVSDHNLKLRPSVNTDGNTGEVNDMQLFAVWLSINIDIIGRLRPSSSVSLKPSVMHPGGWLLNVSRAFGVFWIHLILFEVAQKQSYNQAPSRTTQSNICTQPANCSQSLICSRVNSS